MGESTGSPGGSRGLSYPPTSWVCSGPALVELVPPKASGLPVQDSPEKQHPRKCCRAALRDPPRSAAENVQLPRKDLGLEGQVTPFLQARPLGPAEWSRARSRLAEESSQPGRQGPTSSPRCPWGRTFSLLLEMLPEKLAAPTVRTLTEAGGQPQEDSRGEKDHILTDDARPSRRFTAASPLT